MSESNGTDSAPKLRPEAGDTRYDLRLKRRLAQDCSKLADKGLFENALEALYELGMGEKIDGTEIENIEERTRVQALSAFTRAVSSAAPSDGTTVNIDHLGDRNVQVFDRDGMLEALRDGKFRTKALEPPETGKNGEASDE